VPDLWIPGAAAPSLDDFVERVHKQIERYTAGHGADRTCVEIQLADGERLVLQSLSGEPGYGFVTLTAHAEDDDTSHQLIVPVTSVRRIDLRPAEGDRIRFGFALPDGDAGQKRKETEPTA
jgi:hypothetical protein